MKKCFFLILLSFIMLLSACSVDSRLVLEPTPSQIDWAEFKQGQIISLPLSFRSRDGKTLTTEMRDVRIPVGVLIEEAAVSELIRGPAISGNQEIMPQQSSLDKVEVIGNIANVFIKNDGQFYPIDVLIARAALANTLAAVSDIEYVNLYINGREPGYNAHPLGPSKKLIGDLDEYSKDIRQEIGLFAIEQNAYERKDVVMYYPDSSGKYLLAEVREIPFENMSYAATVLNYLFEYSLGKTDGINLFRGVELLSPPVEGIGASGRSMVKIVLSAEPENPALTYGAITYTLIGFIPEIEYVTFFAGGDSSENRVDYIPGVDMFTDGNATFVNLESFAGIIGNNATIFLPADLNSLNEQTVTLYNRHTKSPYFLLETMMEQSKNLPPPYRALPDEFNIRDVISAYVSGDIAILDFKADVLSKCAKLNEQQEFLFVYSITNTMSMITGVKRVQFLVEGWPVDTLGGKIKVHGPMLPNPGIISNKS